MASDLLGIYSEQMNRGVLKEMIADLIKEKSSFLTEIVPVTLDDLTFKTDRRHLGIGKPSAITTTATEDRSVDNELAELRRQTMQIAAQNQSLLKQLSAVVDQAIKDRQDFEDRIAALEARINETNPNYGAF